MKSVISVLLPTELLEQLHLMIDKKKTGSRSAEIELAVRDHVDNYFKHSSKRQAVKNKN